MNRIERQKTYWLRQLSEPPPAPNLPWDKEPPPVSSFIRETVSTKVESEIWGRIKHLTMRLGAPPQAVLLAAHGVHKGIRAGGVREKEATTLRTFGRGASKNLSGADP